MGKKTTSGFFLIFQTPDQDEEFVSKLLGVEYTDDMNSATIFKWTIPRLVSF
jgi:hypothetical protein